MVNPNEDYIWRSKSPILPMIDATRSPDDVLQWRFWLRCVGVAGFIWLCGWLIL